jgi:hypothetical protein
MLFIPTATLAGWQALYFLYSNSNVRSEEFEPHIPFGLEN